MSVEMVDVPLGWHRNRGPKNPGMTQSVDQTLDRLDDLVERLNRGVDRLEEVAPSVPPLGPQPGAAQHREGRE